MYRKLEFLLVPPLNGKPVVFDDTVYLTPCSTEAEARSKVDLLNSDLARDFYSSFIFWDAKRPVTAKILRQLDINSLAAALGADDACNEWATNKRPTVEQMTLAIG